MQRHREFPLPLNVKAISDLSARVKKTPQAANDRDEAEDSDVPPIAWIR